jgi:hypothetical protein
MLVWMDQHILAKVSYYFGRELPRQSVVNPCVASSHIFVTAQQTRGNVFPVAALWNIGIALDHHGGIAGNYITRHALGIIG